MRIQWKKEWKKPIEYSSMEVPCYFLGIFEKTMAKVIKVWYNEVSEYRGEKNDRYWLLGAVFYKQ